MDGHERWRPFQKQVKTGMHDRDRERGGSTVQSSRSTVWTTTPSVACWLEDCDDWTAMVRAGRKEPARDHGWRVVSPAAVHRLFVVEPSDREGGRDRGGPDSSATSRDTRDLGYGRWRPRMSADPLQSFSQVGRRGGRRRMVGWWPQTQQRERCGGGERTFGLKHRKRRRKSCWGQC